jgi:hypothetical protein
LQGKILSTRVPMTVKTERRTQHRKRPLSLVYVELPPSNGGMMRDLSEQGFSLRAMMPVSPSEKIPFSFVLDSSARIDGEAIVLRVEDGGHVAALEFAGLSSHSRDQIRRWLDKFDEPISPDSSPAQSRASKHLSLTELRSQIRTTKSPSSVPSAAETAPSPTPLEITAPPEPEPPPVSFTPAEELPSPPPQIVAAAPITEPPPEPISSVVENAPPPPTVAAPPMPEPPPPPVAEVPEAPPLPTVTALPIPTFPPPQEATPPASRSTIEQPDTPALPPLLKLSSVRPGPLPTTISPEPNVSVAIPKPIPEPPAEIQSSLPTMETPATVEARIAEPRPAPPVSPRRPLTPALEPLSSFEAETDSDTPGWMDRFTLARAIGIMLFLTLLAGSYVYHREVGQALIWLGHQIAGDDSPENFKVVRPQIPSAAQVKLEPAPPAAAIPPPPLTFQQSPDTSEPKSANLPAASDKTPSPELKNPTPGSLVPLNQVTRSPAAAPPVDNPAEAGQQEYLEALQILRSPSRAPEIPAAIQLLWAAVEKGNVSAEIDLAELFRTGRGVAKNCDQARILLSAAARKGSAEARKRLEEFQREGCSN